MPLLIVLPAARARSPAVVDEFVSLRDLPATVVDLIGVAHGSPFPGKSFALVGWSAGREPSATNPREPSPSWRHQIHPTRTRVDLPPVAAH